VTAAANPYATIKIMKRDRSQPRFVFDDADNLVRNPAAYTTGANDSLSKALAEIEINRAFAKAAAPVLEDTTMETDEVMKAAVAKVDSRIAIIMKREPTISRDVAYLRLSTSRDAADQEAWLLFKSLSVVPPTPVSEAPVVVSDAYAKMQEKAGELAKAEGISQASAFAKVYQLHPDLAAEDRQFHLAKAAGGVDPNEILITTLMGLGYSREHATGMALEIRSKAPTGDALYQTRAA
jgi:hypothetical protein